MLLSVPMLSLLYTRSELRRKIIKCDHEKSFLFMQAQIYFLMKITNETSHSMDF